MKIPDQLLVFQYHFFENVAENIVRWDLVNISINIALAYHIGYFCFTHNLQIFTDEYR